MNKENKDRMLFDAVSGIDPELIQEAAEPRVRVFPRYLWRMAACLVLVVGLVLAFVGLPTQDEEKKSAFVIYVYANEGEKVELSEGGYYNIDLSWYLDPDKNLRPERPPRGCSFYIELNDYTRGMTNIDIYCNGELVPGQDKEIGISYAVEHMTGRHLGWYVGYHKKESAILQIVLRAEDGSALYQVDLSVTYVDGSFTICVLPTEPISD